MDAKSVRLPDDLGRQAEREARDQGMSLEQYVCQCVEAALRRQRQTDSLFADDAVFRGPGPADCAAKHDEYLYGGPS